jgi:hypothetical protein
LSSDRPLGKNTRHLLTGLLRQSIFGRLAGYEDVDDTERLARNPAMRWLDALRRQEECVRTAGKSTLLSPLCPGKGEPAGARHHPKRLWLHRAPENIYSSLETSGILGMSAYSNWSKFDENASDSDDSSCQRCFGGCWRVARA